MFLDTTLLIAGGDKRYIKVIEELADRGVTIFLAGFEKLSFTKNNVFQTKLENVDFSSLDGLLLPVAGIKERGKIETVYSDKALHLTEEMWKEMSPDCTIYTGISTPEIERMTTLYNRKIVKLFDDETAILNSIPTAEGALHLAIQHTEITIHDSNVCVLGFGRVGSTVAGLFQNAGANVSVAARKRTDRARAFQMGLLPVEMEELTSHISGQDICINTVPELLLSRSILSKMNLSCLVIDLASHPGGTDFDSAAELGIQAIHALGLPGKTAPETAGKIISTALLKFL